MINLLLVDDHTVVRTGMKLIIQNFLPHSQVDEAFDGDSAFEKIREKDYDLAILDVNMPNTDSFSLVSNIVSFKPKTRILMFSMNDEAVFARRYMKLGAMGYIKKDEPEEEIKKAITTILDNRKYISTHLRDSIIDEMISDQSENPFDKLSPREFEIVQHLVRGESVASISEQLNLHTSTIGTHKARIFQKLKCENIIQLSELAKIHRII